MSGRATEAAAVAAVAALLTIAVAAPVLRAPSERIFGMEIVGRHHDPFTAMELYDRPLRWTAFLQPITDVPGRIFAKYLGAVQSYTLVVLLSFPLTAVATYLLARHCALSPAGATAAALAVAFSPFHLAHAAYHPHVSQLQWLPLYLLVLWRCLDAPTWRAAALLALAVVAVTLSNFYGGLIAAFITPIAIAAYWFFTLRRGPASIRRVIVTVATLGALAVAGAAYAAFFAGDVFRGESPVGFGRGDLSRYGATWWGYLTPPVAHPWLGGLARRAGESSGAALGLLEQQLTLGWGLIALSVVAVAARLRHRGAAGPLTAVPVLAAVATVALVCSFPPPSWLYDLLPMFRAYARFGSVVQLMIALLAAIGAEWLWQSRARHARLATMALLLLAVSEYAVWPPALWRDVLPTAAHRWAVRQPASTRVLDCYPYTQESQSVHWLTGGRVILRAHSLDDCREPGVIATLAATGFTHMLVRRNTPEGQSAQRRPAPAGLRLAARFADAEVFAVAEPPSLVRTIGTQAFYPAEFGEEWTWRWMGPQASWTVVNSSARALEASVDLETTAFHERRRLAIVLDGGEVQDVDIDAYRAIRRIGPLTLQPGAHTLIFRAASAPSVADDLIHNGDRRALSVAFGDWRWSVDGGAR